MAHRALTLKYRPQVFADLVGQEHVTRVLIAALESGRVAHAFLFTGARGVGKTTSARILAKALNCERRQGTAEPCNECTSCTEIAAGVSLDVLEIDGASNRGIADVQQLRESVRFAPTGGRNRVEIIDEVHQLSGDAFAALLKTLEEPPAHLVFIFATTDPQKLPDTIRSRTQRFDFARVPIRRVADRLLEIQKREAADKKEGANFQLSDGAALLIAHKGEGSMRDAVSALDQVVSAGEPAIDEALVRRVLGIPDHEVYFRLAGAILAHDPAATLRHLHEAFATGADARELAEGLATHFRNVLVLKVDPSRGHDLVPASNEDLARLVEQGKAWADSDLLRLMRLASDCQWPMRDSPQPMVHLEAAVMQMATLEPAESIATLLGRLEALERKLNGAGSVSVAGATTPAPPARGGVASSRTHGFAAAPPSVAPAPPAAPPAPVRPVPLPAPAFTQTRMTAPVPEPAAGASNVATIAEEPELTTTTATSDEPGLDEGVRRSWNAAVDGVNGRKRMLGAFLQDIRLVGVAGDTLVLAMTDLQRSVVDTAESRALMQEELARTFGRSLALRFVAEAGETPEQRAAKADSLASVIDRAREVFDGEVIDRGRRPGGEQSP